MTSCIVCLGDSITSGYGLTRDQSWPARLEATLLTRDSHVAWRVVNAGVPGDTILQGLARLERDVLAHQPAVVFIAFGLNDAHLARRSTDVQRERALFSLSAERGGQAVQCHRWRSMISRLPFYRPIRSRLRPLRRFAYHTAPIVLDNGSMPRVSLPAFEHALGVAVERLRREVPGVRIFLVTPTPLTENFHPDWTPDQRERQRELYRQYIAAVRAVACSLNTGLVDAAVAFPDDDLARFVGPDGVHLTEAGQARLADMALHALITANLVGGEASHSA